LHPSGYIPGDRTASACRGNPVRLLAIGRGPPAEVPLRQWRWIRRQDIHLQCCAVGRNWASGMRCRGDGEGEIPPSGGATLLWVPCAEKFGHSTWRNATASSLDLRDPQGSSVPIAVSEGGGANSSCWRVRASSSCDNGVKRTARRSCALLLGDHCSTGDQQAVPGLPKEARGPTVLPLLPLSSVAWPDGRPHVRWIR
jgi:hypothetical protein